MKQFCCVLRIKSVEDRYLANTANVMKSNLRTLYAFAQVKESVEKDRSNLILPNEAQIEQLMAGPDNHMARLCRDLFSDENRIKTMQVRCLHFCAIHQSSLGGYLCTHDTILYLWSKR